MLVLLARAADLRWIAREGPGQVALDSVAATVGLLLAFLLYGRFLDSRQQGDALLSSALLSLAAGNLLFAVVPVVVGDSSRLSSASAVAGLGAGVLFPAAVLARRDAVSSSRHVPAMVVLLAALVLATSWLTSRLLPRSGGASADTAGIGSDPFLVVVQVLAAAAFLAAAVGWCREAARGERLAPLLAVASVLAASFRVTFALATDGDAPEVTAGTLLRAAFLRRPARRRRLGDPQLLAAGGDVAVLEERRRIARDLHDGLAQELAFTATQAQALAERSDHPARAQLVAAAAQRALDESRRAIAALTRPIDEPVEVALAQSAEDVCGRFGTGLVLDVQSVLQVAATEHRPDVVLLDVHMPGSGIEAARAIGVELPDAAVVMLTVSRDDGDLFEALRAGARGYLLKDIDPARLPHGLRGVLGGEAALPRALVARLVDEFRSRERAPSRSTGPAASLTEREWQVLELLREGHSTAAIAERLDVTPVTVRSHVSAVLRKLGVDSRAAAVRLVADDR